MPMSGRRAQAARNDALILAAAREVFFADPTAPIAAVAQRAGVGLSALYRRYASKDQLLQTLCADGLHRFIEVAEAALDERVDPRECLEVFIAGIVDADVHSLTVKLAGTFPTTPELFELASRAHTLNGRVLARAPQRPRGATGPRPQRRADDLRAARGDPPRRPRAKPRTPPPLPGPAPRGDPPPAQTPPLPGTSPTDHEYRRRWERRA